MQNLKIKQTLLGLMILFGMTVFMTSCDTETPNTVDIETEEVTIDALESVNDRIAETESSIRLPFGIEGTEEEITTLVKSLSKEEFLKYQKDFVIAEALVSKGIMKDNYDKEWEDVSLSELELENFLDAQEVNQIENKLNELENGPEIISRASCCWHRIYVAYNCGCGGYYIWRYECTTNTVVLFEGNHATQDLVGILDVHYNRDIRFKSHYCCPNDEARSAELWNMKAGQDIILFDDSDPTGTYSDTKDDYIHVYIKRNFDYKQLPTFEESFSDSDVTATYRRGGNLDGKVSHFKCRQ